MAWSRDGKFLVLSDKTTSASSLALYIMSLDTGDKRQLTLPPNGYFGDFGPAFSRDGKVLAFGRVRSSLQDAIYVLPISETGEARAAPQRLIVNQQWIFALDWTADSRNIVFSSGQLGSSTSSPPYLLRHA
jgi:Tol biopolymer transport system component